MAGHVSVIHGQMFNKKYFMGQHAHGVQQWRIGNSYARREVRHIMSFCNRTGSSCVRNLHAHGERLLVDYGVGNSHDLQVCEKRTAKKQVEEEWIRLSNKVAATWGQRRSRSRR